VNPQDDLAFLSTLTMTTTRSFRSKNTILFFSFQSSMNTVSLVLKHLLLSDHYVK